MKSKFKIERFFVTALFLILIASLSKINCQIEKSENTHSISRGINFEFSPFYIIPTHFNLFKSIRDNDEKTMSTISKEWKEVAFPFGEYWAISKNIGREKPIILGISLRGYELYYEFDSRFTSSIDWELINVIDYNNYNAFINYPIWYKRKTSVFLTTSFGASHYKHRVHSDWKKTSSKESDRERMTILKNNSVTINTEFGVGLRWQVIDILAIQFKINYQLEGFISFIRYHDVLSMNVNLADEVTAPEKENYSVIIPDLDQSPPRTQYENLNLQIGIAFDLSKLFGGK
jgi:hypothetical protein